MLFTSTNLKAMLFVSLALASNAALPPKYQKAAEEKRIRNSPHMKEMIGNNPKWGITKIEQVPYVSAIDSIDGYTILNQYKVSAKTHGEARWMTQQGFINKDFTVYAVASKKVRGMCGPINFGLLFQDYYLEFLLQDRQSGFVNGSSSATTTLAAAVSSRSSAPPADCDGVKEMIKLNPRNKEQVLPNTDAIGYMTEHRMVGFNQPQGFVGNDVLPFRSLDKSIVTCKLIDTTPEGFCGGKIYQQRFIANKFGRTKVTNGPVSYTIQVGLLNN